MRRVNLGCADAVFHGIDAQHAGSQTAQRLVGDEENVNALFVAKQNDDVIKLGDVTKAKMVI